MIQRLAQLAGYRQPDQALPSGSALELLTIGHEPALIHIILGAAGIRSGDVDRAQTHLAIANGVMPSTARLLGILALNETQRLTHDAESHTTMVPLLLLEQPFTCAQMIPS